MQRKRKGVSESRVEKTLGTEPVERVAERLEVDDDGVGGSGEDENVSMCVSLNCPLRWVMQRLMLTSLVISFSGAEKLESNGIVEMDEK